LTEAKEVVISSSQDQHQDNSVTQECFVIMPISDPEGYEKGHFRRVYEDIFIPAIKKAGFKPVRADDNNAANLIQLEILRKLIDCPMAICDLSNRNPNVLFELGIRQAFDKPVVLVQECNNPKIFDISSINTLDYRKERIYHHVLEDQQKICNSIIDTYKVHTEGSSTNSIVRLLSLSSPATLKDIEGIKNDPSIQFIMSEFRELKQEIRNLSKQDMGSNCNNVQYSLDREKMFQLKNILSTMIDNGEDIPNKFIQELKTLRNKYRTLASDSNIPMFHELALEYEFLHDMAVNNSLYESKNLFSPA